ncbi:class I SAM-dependent methyltransferase [Actinomadura opuntiae]|uniref:class I SAM-dependent methyltransferase n=1 Tax=Actinomadura sp. OS1-43 TaxID=604315 RepID=UPI00255B20CC|nr:class I SAM-dependent methyltransferase [Actinomadura sp. OS1-43]MDL4814184.1 class I SAM-dependent methyltransferase [Actinomadura sp. OS1-43]
MQMRPVSLLIPAGFVVDALWRRSRAAGLPALPSADRPVDARHRFVTAAGTRLDEATKRAASAYADDHGLAVLELVPDGLDTARALELVRRLHPRSYRTARLARGIGAGYAMLVDVEVLERAGVRRLTGLSPVEMDELAVRLKCYAPVTTDVAVVPGPSPVPWTPGERRLILRRRWIADLPVYLAGNILCLCLLGTWLAGSVATGHAQDRRPGLYASGRRRAAIRAAILLAAVCARPYIVTLGTPLQPDDLARSALTGPFGALVRWLRVATAPEPPDPDLPRLRREYADELGMGLARFFDRPTGTCPCCGGTDLRGFLSSGDHQHHRPGVFHLHRCRACGHVFQNPRLNADGLAFYYRDYYDGSGAAEVERAFRLAAPIYRDRARMLRGHAAPRSWLDVGGGHGHFCNAARDVWPQTRFDALDLNDGIREAERRGWIDTGHVGTFPELADKLTGAYDVVSMHHYLEHTTAPRRELDAAARVLEPGGHLLIEVPDPQWAIARLAGRWWHAWFQPQHLNLVPLGNLSMMLAELGFRPVAVQRGAAHQPIDLFMIVHLLVHRIVPDPAKPWRDPRWRRTRVAARTAVYLAAGPLMLAAAMADQLIHPIIRRSERSNTYRILAQRLPNTDE